MRSKTNTRGQQSQQFKAQHLVALVCMVQGKTESSNISHKFKIINNNNLCQCLWIFATMQHTVIMFYSGFYSAIESVYYEFLFFYEDAAVHTKSKTFFTLPWFKLL